MLNKNIAPPGGLEPPTFRLTAERASQLRHGGFMQQMAQIHAELYADCTTEASCGEWPKFMQSYMLFRYGLVVRIPGSHPGGPGSIPGNGKFWFTITE